MNVPILSVVIPVYNGAAWLAETLGSIQRQRQPGLEIIVIDDGSADASREVVRTNAPAARYFKQENQGPSAARNAGLAHVRSPLVAFLDQDDEWPDGSLAPRLAALAADPAAWFVQGRTRSLAAGVALPEPWVSSNLGAGLFRRALFERVGLFNPACRLTDDIDWFLRVREAGLPYVTLPEVTLHYRRGTGGLTHGRSWQDGELLATVRASLARRRRDGRDARELRLLSGSAEDPRASGPVPPAPP